jgi:AMME syndrome candidate gene 1 protein
VRVGRARGAACRAQTKEQRGVFTLNVAFSRSTPPRPVSSLPPTPNSPLFVTWDAACPAGAPPRLRGCIGTLEPRPLRDGLRDYALTSALRDRRFPPIAPAELPALHCTVSLLRSFERTDAWDAWTVGTHGLTIEFEDPDSGRARSATYLPAVAQEQGWDHGTAFDSLMRKAGYGGAITAALRREVAVTRYQASTAKGAFAALFGGGQEDGGGLQPQRDGLVGSNGGRGKWAFA